MNNKLRRFWPVWPIVIMLIALMILMTVFPLTIDNRNKVILMDVTVTVFAIGAVLLVSDRLKSDIADFMRRLVDNLTPADRNAVTAVPLPAVMLGYRGEIIWYSPAFLSEVMNGVDCMGGSIIRACPGFDMENLRLGDSFQLKIGERWYSCAASICKGEDNGRYMVFFDDITDLKATEERYIATRPTVMLIVFDNEDELLKARESERMRVISAVDAVINKWADVNSGICWADARDKSLIVLEETEAQKLIDEKFTILDMAKTIVAEDGTPVTLSIGVGRGGESIEQCETWALQALDMALGRGGDQAVVHDQNGYSFFGGVAGSTEIQSRVRIRMCSTSFAELLDKADNCIIMGHSYSDLDAVGASIGLSAIARSMKKEVFIAIDKASSLAGELVDYYAAASAAASDDKLFVHPSDALDHLRENTLLVIADTHSASFVESSELYERCKNIVVIDHHRMMVNHIENYRLFVHETYASSACEIVTEMASYIAENAITRAEANALMAGIMLDTKNFVIRAGVRTFEASAFLKRRGADTVEVKRLFAETLDSYIAKARLVSSAELYRGCAIACTTEQFANQRIVSAQAADDMLMISDVNASFVLFESGGRVNISGRSYGKINVQMILERLGGGGHLTMAGAQLSDVTMAEALNMLYDSIDKQRDK